MRPSLSRRIHPIRLGVALLVGALVGVAGCRGNPTPGSCQPVPCAQPCPQPCEVWTDPVYGNPCGGDQGVGRTGTGAFAR